MAYSPPPGSAVPFNFTGSYSPPYGLTVTFNFGAISPPSSNANIFRALQTAIDDEANWRDPRARQFYAPTVSAPILYPFRRTVTAATILGEQEDWRDPRARQFYSPPLAPVAAIYPFARRDGVIAAMLADDVGKWTDPRSRMRYGFHAAIVGATIRPVLFTVM